MKWWIKIDTIFVFMEIAILEREVNYIANALAIKSPEGEVKVLQKD